MAPLWLKVVSPTLAAKKSSVPNRKIRTGRSEQEDPNRKIRTARSEQQDPNRKMAAEWVKLADAALAPTADGMI
jgi:hypothetical protein